MFIVSIALLISSATVIVHTGGGPFGVTPFLWCYLMCVVPVLCVHTQIVEVDLALYHMCILADQGHLPLIVSDGRQFASSMLCLNT